MCDVGCPVRTCLPNFPRLSVKHARRLCTPAKGERGGAGQRQQDTPTDCWPSLDHPSAANILTSIKRPITPTFSVNTRTSAFGATKAAMVVCPSCQLNENEVTASQIYCRNCGIVLEESQIVSDVTFAENSAGGAVVQGSYVGNEQRECVLGRIEPIVMLTHLHLVQAVQGHRALADSAVAA